MFIPARRWLLHCLCFALPLATTAFVWLAPGLGVEGGTWLLLVVLAIAVDLRAGPERSQPPASTPAWPFQQSLWILVALQLVNVLGLAWLAAGVGLLDWRLHLGILLTGMASGYTGIVVAHELVHRRERALRWAGRLLLATVLYEHFATEHVRGHHLRIGTGADPATARHGERLGAFLLRTVPGQFRSAWALEAERLGHPAPFSPRWFGSAVVQGLLLGWGLLLLVGLAFGPVAALAWAWQAAIAVLLLECVNYIEHWGLTRAGRRVTTVDSWDTESWFSYYSLVGLTRHADHHANAARPFQALRHVEESPKMPHGYWGMVVRALWDDRALIAELDAELARRRLGPYREAGAE